MIPVPGPQANIVQAIYTPVSFVFVTNASSER
jgi:hypothetical protein